MPPMLNKYFSECVNLFTVFSSFLVPGVLVFLDTVGIFLFCSFVKKNIAESVCDDCYLNTLVIEWNKCLNSLLL